MINICFKLVHDPKLEGTSMRSWSQIACVCTGTSLFGIRFMLQIYKGDSSTCAILIPAWGSNKGYAGFSCDQSNCGLSPAPTAT